MAAARRGGNRPEMTSDLSSFRCRRCGACCRLPGGLVRLREGESAALAAALGMDERTFLDEHTLLAPDRRSLVLRDHADGSCEMLGEDGLCRVHAAKPAQCREFPLRWRNPDSVRSCPGLRALDVRPPTVDGRGLDFLPGRRSSDVERRGTPGGDSHPSTFDRRRRTAIIRDRINDCPTHVLLLDSAP